METKQSFSSRHCSRQVRSTSQPSLTHLQLKHSIIQVSSRSCNRFLLASQTLRIRTSKASWSSTSVTRLLNLICGRSSCLRSAQRAPLINSISSSLRRDWSRLVFTGCRGHRITSIPMFTVIPAKRQMSLQRIGCLFWAEIFQRI